MYETIGFGNMVYEANFDIWRKIMVYRVAEVGKEDIVDRSGLRMGNIFMWPIFGSLQIGVYCRCLSQTGYIRIFKNAPTAKSIKIHVLRCKFPTQEP